MRIFVTKVFRRLQRQERIDDAALCEAIARAERGLVDSDIGGGLIKQRVARKGQGRRGGYRTIIAYRTATRSVFLFGFAKSKQDNIAVTDLREMVSTGSMLLALDIDAIEVMIDGGGLWEVECDDEHDR